MAEPTNTPLPTAPGTPISATPRSASPAPGFGEITPMAGGARGPSSLAVPMPIPMHVSATLPSSPSFSPPPPPLAPSSPEEQEKTAQQPTTTEFVVPPLPPSKPHPGFPLAGGHSSRKEKPRVLHIGDPIRYNPEAYADFAARFEVVRPEAAERERAEFARALRERRWGDFEAIYRPFWGSGGEMGSWDAELIALLPDSVRVFASAGAGFDWADVKLLGERGIIYCNGGLAAAEAVADFAAAMIISTFRALPYCIASATSASPDAFRACHALATAQSHNLRGRTLGLVGLGNIGQRVARRMRAGFGMEVLYYDVERKSPAIEAELTATTTSPSYSYSYSHPSSSLSPNSNSISVSGSGSVYRDSLERLARESDCVVLCAPAGAGTLVNRATLSCFRPGARLVNVARGALVDEAALADALDEGRIGAVALDVHAAEPEAVHPRLAAHAGERALLTCHNAGGTVETHAGFEELGMRNIVAVLSEGDAITPVNLQYLRKKGT